jgi:hypothetical protein
MKVRAPHRHFLRVVDTCLVGVVSVAVGCGTIVAPKESPPAQSASPASGATVAPLTIDPAAASFLSANGNSFDVEAAPSDLPVTASRAIEILRGRTRGPILRADAIFGILHANLGALANPRAWLVLLVGPGLAGQPGSASPASSPATTVSPALFYVWAFINADSGAVLLEFGTSPP